AGSEAELGIGVLVMQKMVFTPAAIRFIAWLDRSVHSHWFSEPEPKKSNYEKRDREQKSIRSVLCDPEWPKIAVLNNPVNGPSQKCQSGHGANQPPCAAP